MQKRINFFNDEAMGSNVCFYDIEKYKFYKKRINPRNYYKTAEIGLWNNKGIDFGLWVGIYSSNTLICLNSKDIIALADELKLLEKRKKDFIGDDKHDKNGSNRRAKKEV